jgi:GTPase involved in cell partitioning and DNA repair
MHRCRRGRRPERRRTPALRIGVPLGTVVKRKRGGALLGELTRPGQSLLVAQGGPGGRGVLRPGSEAAQRGRGRLVEEVPPPHFALFSLNFCRVLCPFD